jgi:4-diphosphocytidyl-2-C-methyl-D-erythritol kinase
MTGVGEVLLPLDLPELPSVLVNPRIPVATKDVFTALGLRNGELLVGAADVIEAPAWPKGGASVAAWVKALGSVGNDLQRPAIKIQPVIAEVIATLAAADGVRLARMSGSGATCFALFADQAHALAASEVITRAHPDWWVHAGTLS